MDLRDKELPCVSSSEPFNIHKIAQVGLRLRALRPSWKRSALEFHNVYIRPVRVSRQNRELNGDTSDQKEKMFDCRIAYGPRVESVIRSPNDLLPSR